MFTGILFWKLYFHSALFYCYFQISLKFDLLSRLLQEIDLTNTEIIILLSEFANDNIIFWGKNRKIHCSSWDEQPKCFHMPRLYVVILQIIVIWHLTEGFNTSRGAQQMLMYQKSIFDSYYCIEIFSCSKTLEKMPRKVIFFLLPIMAKSQDTCERLKKKKKKKPFQGRD